MKLTSNQKIRAALMLDSNFQGGPEDMIWSDAELEGAYSQVLINNARTAAIERVETAYRAALRSFEHAETTWDASDEAAGYLRDLLNRLANDRGLPRGKTTVKLRDNTGTTHDLDAEEIKDLGEAGSDHRDACMERRRELLDQITVAESEDDLPDVTKGWPD